jgi:hypothetical protein
MIALIGSALVARHNLRLGRGDVSGAVRIAFVYFVVRLLFWLFETHHNGSIKAEFLLLLTYLSLATFTGFYLWLLYIALEPFLRRRWPHRIISWSRLLRGEFRDPLVGRHILIGSACGALLILRHFSGSNAWLGIPFDLMSNPGARSRVTFLCPFFGAANCRTLRAVYDVLSVAPLRDDRAQRLGVGRVALDSGRTAEHSG